MPFSAVSADDDPIARMGRAWRELRRGHSTAVVRDRLFGVGSDAVDPAHMDVLDVLVLRDHSKMSELAQALRVDPSTVTRTLQRMEAAGLAQRRPSPDDKRCVIVRLTPLGRQRHNEVAERRTEILAEILGSFTEPEREHLVEMVERFIESADKYVAGLATDERPGP